MLTNPIIGLQYERVRFAGWFVSSIDALSLGWPVRAGRGLDPCRFRRPLPTTCRVWRQRGIRLRGASDNRLAHTGRQRRTSDTLAQRASSFGSSAPRRNGERCSDRECPPLLRWLTDRCHASPLWSTTVAYWGMDVLGTAAGHLKDNVPRGTAGCLEGVRIPPERRGNRTRVGGTDCRAGPLGKRLPDQTRSRHYRIHCAWWRAQRGKGLVVGSDRPPGPVTLSGVGLQYRSPRARP